jgi:homeobox protein cut-like
MSVVISSQHLVLDPQLNQALQGAIESWSSKIQYSSLIQNMNTNVAEVWKAQKEQSLQTRKVLAETTKQFKKSVKIAEQAVIQLNNDASNSTTDIVITSMDALSNECRSTIKLYQEEIDSLTRRCKNVEQEYQSIYTQLRDVPDPTLIFNHCNEIISSQYQQMTQLLSTIESLNQELQKSEKLNTEYKEKNHQLEESIRNNNNNSNSNSKTNLSNEERDELINLRKEVTEYEIEFRSLKNQDITIRKLEEKIIELQNANEENVRVAIENAKEEIVQTEGKRITELLERETILQAKVQTLELQLRSERAGREISQNNLLRVDDRVTNQEAVWEVQRNILIDDNERVRELLQSMTRERDDLLQEVNMYKLSSSSRSPPITSSDITTGITGRVTSFTAAGASGNVVSYQDLQLERNAYEAEVTELSESNMMLREEFRQKEERMVDEARNLQSKIDALERDRTSLQTSVTNLEMQLSSAPSRVMIENMKRELRILKRLEYNADEDDAMDDDVDTDRDPEIVGGGIISSSTVSDINDLEAVLVAKLRHAEKALITERNIKTGMQERLEILQQTLTDTEKAKSECEQLVQSLENDLQQAISQATPTISSKKSNQLVMPSVIESSDTLQHILDPSSVPSQLPPPQSNFSSSKLSSTSEKADDDHSVATIVMAQRDRLRARCEALEAERDSFKRELQRQVQSSESLKSDNEKLYEKVRYLQNYSKGSITGTAGHQSGTGGIHHRSSGLADRDLDLEALEQRYEASVDPFKQFSKSERQRKLNEMSPMERAVFVVAKTVLCMLLFSN